MHASIPLVQKALESARFGVSGHYMRFLTTTNDSLYNKTKIDKYDQNNVQLCDIQVSTAAMDDAAILIWTIPMVPEP